MSRRSHYEKLVELGCQCTLGSMGDYFLELMRSCDTTFEADRVVSKCSECGDVVALFYREPEIEESPFKLTTAKAKAAIGVQVSVPRVVAWVGYAKNTRTVEISLEQEEREANRMLCNALVAAGIPVTEKQVERFTQHHLAPSRMMQGLRKDVRWRIFREAFATNPSPRGLWFQDRPFEGTVQEVVTCRTGKYDPGGGYDSYYGDYDPPYLSCPKTHRLYGCVSDDGLGRDLVWPGDVEESNGD